MLIGKIFGGLGNQMFQFAFYKYLQSLKACKLALDKSDYKTLETHYGFELSKVFGVSEDDADPDIASKLMTKTPIFFRLQRKLFVNPIFDHSTHFKETFFNIDKRVFEDNLTDLYVEGYFQTDKYIKKLSATGIFSFQFNEILKANEMQICEPSSVSIHIRGGDYISSWKNRRMFQGICDVDYYRRGIKRIYEICDDPRFFVFSNDKNYACSILPDVNFKFVDWNHGKQSYRDMYLMSLCNHNIIANSSFSWWAAYLNKNENKTVIAPQKWFNTIRINQSDIVPAAWERI